MSTVSESPTYTTEHS